MDAVDTTLSVMAPRVIAPPSRWLAALLLAVACVVGMPVEHAPAAAVVDAPAIESSVVCEQSAPSSNAEHDVARSVRRIRPCDDARALGDRSPGDGVGDPSATPLMSAGRSWRGPPAPSRLV